VKALLDGTIDAIATDHAPHAPHEKAKPIQEAPFGIIGLETAFPLIYTNFVKTSQLSLNKCIDLMSKQAGGLFGLDIGVIKEGSRADLVLFDLESEFEINTEFFASKSQNSPFIGNRLFGKTKLTIFEGKTVFESL
jgi:dihydroorotase